MSSPQPEVTLDSRDEPGAEVRVPTVCRQDGRARAEMPFPDADVLVVNAHAA